MTSAAQAERILVCGHPIKARTLQMFIWSAVVAACGAALVAGVYYNVLEMSWFGHTAKHWWDGGMGVIHAAAWPLYRHGIRDYGEPAIATMAVKTYMAKQKWWNVRVGKLRLVTTPFAVFAVAVAGAVGAVWLADFGFPAAWRYMHTTFGVPASIVAPTLFEQHAWQTALTVTLGVCIGLVVHRIWAPVGAHLQGYYVERSVRRWADHGADVWPLWVSYPLTAPVIRERFCEMATGKSEMGERPGRSMRWVIGLVTLLTAYLVITGFIAHFWIGTGHSFPFLAPH